MAREVLEQGALYIVYDGNINFMFHIFSFL